jgi:hypothetical protein
MNLEQIARRLIVPRLEDLPYWTSPPIQFVYEQTVPVALGAFDWPRLDNANPPALFTPDRSLVDNALYYFRNISLAADISELDFEANIVTTPRFYPYLTADGKTTVLFREPIVMNKFYQDYEYRYIWLRSKGNNQLLGKFVGNLIQGPNLVGKSSVTLKAVISAQEIVDEEFVDLITKQPYPKKGA